MAAYESADHWNHAHPVGTPVRVHLTDGRWFDSRTASEARQWGALAVIRLEDSAMVWTLAAIEPLDAAATAAAPLR